MVGTSEAAAGRIRRRTGGDSVLEITTVEKRIRRDWADIAMRKLEERKVLTGFDAPPNVIINYPIRLCPRSPIQ